MFFSKKPNIASIPIEDKRIASVRSLDGLYMFNNKIYTITDDRSGVSSIWSLDGSKIGTLNEAPYQIL